MLRRVRVDRAPVTRAAETFGVSRPTFYQAQTALQRAGLGGLVPRKRGRRSAHKLTPKVMAYGSSVDHRCRRDAAFIP
jgi:hypothetical protein